MASYTGFCKQCGKEFTSSRSHAEFCSNKCRAAYSRTLKKESAETHGAFSPDSPVAPSSHFSDESTELLKKLIAEIASIKSMMIANMGGQRMDDDLQKKSDFTGATPIATEKPIDPPTVTVVYDEEAARRRTIENTMKSLQDFDF